MNRRILPLALLGLTYFVGSTFGKAREEEIVRSATAVLDQTMAMQPAGIPRSLLADARGVVIVPGMLKGGFVIGARYGEGVLLVRDEAGTWQLPMFVTLAGGSIGWQIGVQATDLILVFKTQRSVNGILNGKLTLGADAAVAAGPVGREAAAATDQRLGAEIYTYSRSRGLFAGVSLDGSVLQIDGTANAAYYPAPQAGEPAAAPPSAVLLAQKVASYTTDTVPAPGDVVSPVGPAFPAPGDGQANAVRDQLAQAAPQLYRLLDAPWRTYLALPVEVFQGGEPPAEALQQSLAHFETVTGDQRYAALAARPEFQSTYALLQHYLQVQTAAPGELQLPPPPTAPQKF